MEAKPSKFGDRDDINIELMEEENESFISDIQEGITLHCPRGYPKGGLKKITWWDAECKRLLE